MAGATRTFFRVTSPQTVVIVPDTPAKRREYEEEIVRTFYLSNADLKETIDLLRLILDARRISPITATNAITIKDTPEHISPRPHASCRPSTRRGPKSSSTSSCSRSIGRSCSNTACRSRRPDRPASTGR